MSIKNKDYEVINGIKVAKDMPVEQKEAMRNDSNDDGLDLNEEDFKDPSKIKLRTTMMMDKDILTAIKSKAKEKGLPYQTYLNQVLRDIFIHRMSMTGDKDTAKLIDIIANLSMALKKASKRSSDEEDRDEKATG